VNSRTDTRLVAGIMSGTSLDGVDVCLVRLSGHQTEITTDVLFHNSTGFNPVLGKQLLKVATSEWVDPAALCRLDIRLAHTYADAIRQAVLAAGLSIDDLDLIGCHGQTVRHVPEPENCAGMDIRSTLQIGDPSVLAHLVGVDVVGDFRMADMGLGGQGAPLVPYLDYVLLSHPTENRGCLNLGGIANLTLLPAGQDRNSVYGFDTGPANMVIDALARGLFGMPYDDWGRLAAQGEVCDELMEALFLDDFLVQKPPKSTGRERFGHSYVASLQSMAMDLPPHDIMATATMFTAKSIFAAYENFVAEHHPLDRLIVAGGGVHNQTLMEMLRNCFAPIPVNTSGKYGIDEDAKEALCFAVLAHETASGHPTGMPSVTGASRSAVLGKYCPAGRQE